MGKKIFVGRLPQEASVEDLRQYFGRFGRILDVYVPKVKIRVSQCYFCQIGPFEIGLNIQLLINVGSQKIWSPRFWFCNFC